MQRPSDTQISPFRRQAADALRRAREIVTTDGAVSAALDAARNEAKQADEALSAAPGLDVAVCESLRSLVDGLVTRSS